MFVVFASWVQELFQLNTCSTLYSVKTLSEHVKYKLSVGDTDVYNLPM